jgi:hypothetical protein
VVSFDLIGDVQVAVLIYVDFMSDNAEYIFNRHEEEIVARIAKHEYYFMENLHELVRSDITLAIALEYTHQDSYITCALIKGSGNLFECWVVDTV